MIQNIVNDAFEKAKKECSSDAKGALSKHISEKITEELKIPISEKTLIRCYNKYILLRDEIGSPITENVNALCKYLGFKDYLEYQNNNKVIPKSKVETINDVTSQLDNNNNTPEDKKDEGINRWGKKIVIIIFSILSIAFLYKNYNSNSISVTNSNQCMVWEKTKYVKISCNKDIHPKYGTKVIPMDKKRMETMKKVVLKRSDSIVTSNKKYLYWYCKIKPNEIAIFTTFGLHPVSGKPLKHLTKGIFKKYVPIHINNKDDFIKNVDDNND